jgi:hypothetical protein
VHFYLKEIVMLSICSVLLVASFAEPAEIEAKLAAISKGLESSVPQERIAALVEAGKLQKNALPIVSNVCRTVADTDQTVALAALDALKSIWWSLRPIALEFRSIKSASGVKPFVEGLVKRLHNHDITDEDARRLIPLVTDLLQPLERATELFRTRFDAEVGVGSIANYLLELGDTSETHVRIASYLCKTRNMVAREYGIKSTFFLIDHAADKTPLLKIAEDALNDSALQFEGIVFSYKLGAAAKPLLPAIKRLVLSDNRRIRTAAEFAVAYIERTSEKKTKKK